MVGRQDTYSDELHAAMRYAGGYVGGEGQAAGFDVSLNHFFQAGLINGHTAAVGLLSRSILA